MFAQPAPVQPRFNQQPQRIEAESAPARPEPMQQFFAQQQAAAAAAPKATSEAAPAIFPSQAVAPAPKLNPGTWGQQVDGGAVATSPVGQKAPEAAKLLYIGVFSAAGDFKGRGVARNGWMAGLRQQFGNNGEVRAEFVIGRRPVKAKAGQPDAVASFIQTTERRAKQGEPWSTPGHDPTADKPAVVDPQEVQLDLELGKEFTHHADLLHIPYEDLPIRVLMFFAHATDTDYRFIMKADVEQDFFFNPVIEMLRQESPTALTHAGQQLLGDSGSGSATEAKTEAVGPGGSLLDQSSDAMVQELGPFL